MGPVLQSQGGGLLFTVVDLALYRGDARGFHAAMEGQPEAGPALATTRVEYPFASLDGHPVGEYAIGIHEGLGVFESFAIVKAKVNGGGGRVVPGHAVIKTGAVVVLDDVLKVFVAD